MPRPRALLSTAAALALAALGSSSARAQPQVASPGGAELRSVALQAGQLVVTVPLVINMSRGLIGSPMDIPFDAYRGFTDDWTLGITTSRGTIQGVGPYGLFRRGDASRRADSEASHVRGIGPFDLNQGVCVTECSYAFSNVGVDGLYRVIGGPFQLATHAGADISWDSDSDFTVRLGVLAKAAIGSDFAFLFDPHVGIALHGGPHTFEVPLAFQVVTDAGVKWGVQTGAAGAFAGAGDTTHGWIGGFGSVGVNEKIEAFVAAAFTEVAGTNASIEGRVLTFGLIVHPF
jgi:hypothetical protein